MNDTPERATIGILPPMGQGTVSMGVAAPVGSVSRKDRERAGKTALYREGSTILLDTELPGSVTLQRRDADGTWQMLDKQPVSHSGCTTIELPDDAASPPSTFRLVFAPRNPNITSWISENIDG